MNKVMEWLQRARNEGLGQTASRFNHRLTRSHRYKKRQNWLEKATVFWGNDDWLKALLPTSQQPVDGALKRLLRTSMLSETSLGFLKTARQNLPEEPIKKIGHKDLSSLHPLFQTRGDFAWHRAYRPGEPVTTDWPLNYPPGDTLSGISCPGDIRLTWEKNRLQFLLNYLLSAPTDEESKLRFILDVLEDWSQRNPFGEGVNWRDTQEIGLRMKVILRVMSRASKINALASRVENLLPLIAKHGLYVENFISHGPDTHNHILTELCAQLHFRYVFRRGEHQEVERKILFELRKQFWSDGSPGEGSINYHLFVIESLIELMLHAETAHPVFASTLKKAIQPMAEFALTMLEEDGSWPAIGDTDSGLGSGLFTPFGAQNRATLLHVLRHKVFNETEGHLPGISNWYEGLGIQKFVSSPENNVAGWALLGPQSPRPGVHRSHHHADRLSFVLKKGETWIFSDPGTTSYNGTMELRRRDRLTSAHSCPGVLGLDQMEVRDLRFGTGSLPRRKNTIHRTDGIFQHVGATITYDGVESSRLIKWHHTGRLILLIDQWRTTKKVEAQSSFVGGPDISFRIQDGVILLLHPAHEGAVGKIRTWSSGGKAKHQSVVVPGFLSEQYGTERESEIFRTNLPEVQRWGAILSVVSIGGDKIWEGITEGSSEFVVNVGHQNFRCLHNGQIVPNHSRTPE